MVTPSTDYPDGLSTGGDGLITWDANLSPLRQTESAGSNLPTYSWEWTYTDHPIITTAFTTNMGTQFSFSAWIKLNHITAYQSLMCGKGTNDAVEEFISYTGASGHNEAIGGEALGSENMGPSVEPVLDQWYHILYTVNGDLGEYYTYVDGVQFSNDTDIHSAVAGTENLLVGATRMHATETDDYFGGHMQQFLHYNRVVTPTEVALLYGSGDGIALPATGTTLQDGLLIYFDFQQENTGASGTFTLTNQAIP